MSFRMRSYIPLQGIGCKRDRGGDFDGECRKRRHRRHGKKSRPAAEEWAEILSPISLR
jgi:hypothetical protein